MADNLEQRALDAVNKEKATVAAWAIAHKGWLIALGVSLVLGFILGHIV